MGEGWTAAPRLDEGTEDMSTNITPERVVAMEMYGETGIAVGDFTDGGGAAGTYTCKFTLPADFYIERIAIVNVTGFAGDTSAVATVGDGSDVDRLNTGTLNVFADAAAIDGGLVSGTKIVGTAFKPVITVTSGSDFGAVSAGQLDIKVFGWMVD